MWRPPKRDLDRVPISRGGGSAESPLGSSKGSCALILGRRAMLLCVLGPTAFAIVQLRPGLIFGPNMDVGDNAADIVAATTTFTPPPSPRPALRLGPPMVRCFPLRCFLLPAPGVFVAAFYDVFLRRRLQDRDGSRNALPPARGTPSAAWRASPDPSPPHGRVHPRLPFPHVLHDRRRDHRVDPRRRVLLHPRADLRLLFLGSSLYSLRTGRCAGWPRSCSSFTSFSVTLSPVVPSPPRCAWRSLSRSKDAATQSVLVTVIPRCLPRCLLPPSFRRRSLATASMGYTESATSA